MKKSIFLLLIVFILSACSPKAYTESMDAGKAALQKGNYTEAVDKFENALEEKKTDEAQNYLQLAESMQEGLKLFHEGDFDAAEYTLNKMVKDNSSKEIDSTVISQAKELIKKVQEAKTLSDSLKEKIIKGKTLLEQNQFEQAYTVFKEVSETTEFPEVPSIEELAKDGSKLLNEAKDKKEAAALEKQQQEEAEKQKEEEANKSLSHEQAEELVRKHLNLESEPDIKVVYDHDADNGDYIIHVYEFVVDNAGTGEGHTATRGWYGVNKETKIIYDAMN